jgi:large subunit ribosomal protein L23
MALFSKKTNKQEKAKTASEPALRSLGEEGKTGIRSSKAHILRHARITEKATMHADQSVYVFEVAQTATKRDIVMAIRDIYNVTPRMIRIASIPTKTTRNMRTGVSGIKRGGKKAYVFLKKGETIIIS